METGQLVIDPDLLLEAYASGLFPMADSADSFGVNWYEPRKRGVLPLDSFHVSRNVLRLDRNGGLEARFNHDFPAVIAACADREETWINPLIRDTYIYLHLLGHAHSVEVYREGELVGGLYGVTLGAAFFGESMFHRRPEMDKIALLHCQRRLVERGFRLWDAQFYTPHLGTFGCVEISQRRYLGLLEEALKVEASFA